METVCQIDKVILCTLDHVNLSAHVQIVMYNVQACSKQLIWSGLAQPHFAMGSSLGPSACLQGSNKRSCMSTGTVPSAAERPHQPVNRKFPSAHLSGRNNILLCLGELPDS